MGTEDQDEAEPWDLLANALGTLSEVEDDIEGLDFLEGEQAAEPDGFTKIPLEKASNLLKLRGVATGLAEGTVTPEKFLAVTRNFLRPLKDGLQLLGSQPVKAQVTEMPDEQAQVFFHLQEQLEFLSQGLEVMLRYQQSESLEEVERGLEQVEQAMENLDFVQDRAIELGQEEELREAQGS